MTPTVGVLGGSGAVGAHALRLLSHWEAGSLRVGGRDGARARAAAAAVGGTAVAVDVADHDALARFVDGCAVVVNCAGPSSAVSAPVAAAARAAGTALVDAGSGGSGGNAVRAAGALPGLSGLLPRWLAARTPGPPHGLVAHHAVRDAFTAAAALDYLDGVLGAGTRGLAAWRDGGPRDGAAVRDVGVELPFLGDTVTLLPHLDGEGEALCRDLGLREATFSAAVSPRMAAALGRAVAADRDAAAAGIVRAAALDVAGRAPQLVFVARLDTADGTSRAAVLRGPGISAVTGAVAAAAAVAVLSDEVAPGSHLAARGLDPVATLDRLIAAGAVTVQVHDGTAAVVEGVL